MSTFLSEWNHPLNCLCVSNSTPCRFPPLCTLHPPPAYNPVLGPYLFPHHIICLANFTHSHDFYYNVYMIDSQVYHSTSHLASEIQDCTFHFLFAPSVSWHLFIFPPNLLPYYLSLQRALPSIVKPDTRNILSFSFSTSHHPIYPA